MYQNQKTDDDLSRIKSLFQIYNAYFDYNHLSALLFNEKLLEFELEYLIKNYELSKYNWGYISYHQTLSEEFIKKYSDLVDWAFISRYQKLSEEFIEKYLDKVDLWWIFKYQVLSNEFKEKYKDELEKYLDKWENNTCQH